MAEVKKGSLLGAICLVAGTAIGGGMLALPVLTAPGGFFPAILITLLCWLFMLATGLIVVEIFLWNKNEMNFVTMAQNTLGLGGKIVAWILYLFLFYSLTTAYISGGGSIVSDVIDMGFNMKITPCLGPLLFVLIFAPFVVVGPLLTGRINLILMLGLIVSFLLFVFLGARHVEMRYLTRSNLGLALLATPVVFTSFGYQGSVPTLTQYLGRDRRKTSLAIIIGTFIPFLFYIVWEWLILGVVPKEGLEDALKQGQSAVYPLRNILHVPWLFKVGEFFAFFALVTSFFGVTLGLIDFLRDGLKLQKTFQKRFLLGLLVFLPTLAFSMINPCVFLSALHYAGGLGCALLLGLLPLLMVWQGRYRQGLLQHLILPGGKPLLVLLILFIVFELVVICWKLAF